MAKCNICIPTGNRNKWVNRVANVWSGLVLIGFILGLAGGVFNYTATDGITKKMYEMVSRQVGFLEDIGKGQVTPAEATLFIKKMPRQLKKELVGSLRGTAGIPADFSEADITPERIQEVFQMGYTTADLDALKADGTFVDRSANGDAANQWDTWAPADTWTPPATAGVHDWQPYEPAEMTAWNAVDHNDPNTWTTFDATYDTHAADHMPAGHWDTTGAWVHATRRRLFSTEGLPSTKQMNLFEEYRQQGLLVLVAFALVGPLLTTLGMIFFCCQLKALSDDKETACESCFGTISGCIIFPVLFILGAVFCILSLLFSMIMCVFLTVPFELLNVMMELKANIEVAAAVEAYASIPALFKSVYPLLRGAAMTAQNGSLCTVATDGSTSYLLSDILDYDTTDCDNWLTSYRLGSAASILCCVAAILGLPITLYIGYKACCRNRRGSKTDVEMGAY